MIRPTYTPQTPQMPRQQGVPCIWRISSLCALGASYQQLAACNACYEKLVRDGEQPPRTGWLSYRLLTSPGGEKGFGMTLV